MGECPQTPDKPIQRHVQSYEDPHYHDEDEAIPPDGDGEGRPIRRPIRRPIPGKLSRRSPSPPRRFHED